MFERFTDRARRVLILAQEEVRLLQAPAVGPEHILLGLIEEGEGVAAVTLRSFGLSVEMVREKVEASVEPVSAPATRSDFTPEAKKVLELSLREALQLGHNYIGTEHVLLGLIRDAGSAAELLDSVGIPPAALKQEVMRLLAGYKEQTPAKAPAPKPLPAKDLAEMRERAAQLTVDVFALTSEIERLREQHGP